MAKKWSKKEINEYLGTKQISQDNYVAPTVRVNTRKEPSKVESNEPTIRSIESTVNTLNSVKNNKPKSFEFTVDDKKQPSLGNKIGFVAKSGGAGLTSGLTGIVDAPLQNMQEGAKKGKNKSNLENYVKGALKTLDIYGISNIPEIANESSKIMQDKNKKGWEKALNIGGAILNNNPIVNSLEASGQQMNILNKNAEKDIAKTRQAIETPSNKLNEKVQKESQNMGKGWQLAGEVNQTIGNMLPSMAATAITKNPNIGLAAMGVSVKGQATNEAEDRGANLNEANQIGLAKGLTEVGTETLTGGLKFLGKGSADDLVEKGINKIVKNKTGNFVAKQLAGIGGEIGEETISDLVGTAIDKATVDPDATYTFDDWKRTALTTMLSTGALNTISGGYGKQAYQLNAEELEQIVQNEKVQKAINERVEQLTNSNMTPQEVAEIRQEATEVILGEIQQNVDDIIDSAKQEIQQPQIPTQTPLNALNQGVREQNVEIPYQVQTPQITPLNQVNQELQETRKNDIADSVQAMNLEKQPEFKQKQGNYVYEKHENPKIDTLRQDIAKHFTDSEETRNFAKTLEKIIEDKNVDIRFNPNLRDSQGRIANGSYSNGVITLNPNSNRAGEFLTIHELTHAIGTKPMIKMIENYRKSNAEFNNAVEKLLGTYNATEINEEALADISGQLFGNQEYINKLSTENKNLFNKLYNEIKYLWHQLRGYKNQNEFIEDLYHKWDQAYRRQKVQQKAKQTNKTGYSINEDTGKLQENGKDVTLETSKTGNTGTLMAIHNLNEDKLKGILELGGFPVPSIAITNPSKVNHSQFGNISVLFDKNTIDPAIKANEVFDRDVWSPTFPKIEYDLDTKVIERARKAVGGYGNEYLSRANSTLNNIEDKINSYGPEAIIDDLKSDKNFKYVYYKNLNPDFELFTKQDTQDLSSDYSNAMLKEFADEYGEVPNWGSISDEQRQDIVNKFGEKLIPYLEERANKIIEEEKTKEKPRMFIIGMAKGSVDNIKEKMGALGWQDKLIANLNKIQNEGTTRTVNDYETTNEYINNNINQKDYEKWIDDTFKGLVSKKGIYNGKEYLTSQGNRRTFNQLHDDYNLANLVKALTKQDTVGGEQGFGAGQNFGTLQAKMSNKFNSIEDIKNAENRIQYDENTKTTLDNYSETIYDYMNQLRDYSYNKSNNYYYGDNAGYALNDFASYKNQTIQNLNKALENNGINSNEVPLELKQQIVNSINALKNIPTDYFEAKPQRAVGLDEVQQIVIPNNVDAEFKKQLQDAGLSYAEYDPNIENDRQRVINQFDDLKFSKDNQTWKEYLEKEFPSQGTRTNLQGINERNKPKQENKTTQEEKPQEMPKKVVKQEVKKSYLTTEEQNELENLRELDNTGLLDETDSDYKRLQELERKSQGITTKYPELKAKNTFDDIKSIYGKYKNSEISKENNKVLNEAKNFIEANKQGRRTIEEWKQIAEFIGSNADIKNSQDLQKLAIETWINQKPNTKEQLNRQGKKYVPFAVQDWVNAVYKGAGVGTDIKMSKEENTINENKQNNSIKITSKDVVNVLNKTKKGESLSNMKLRSWIDTSNAATDMEKSIDEANIYAITYEVQSNKKTYDQAVENTKNLSYEQKIFNAQNKLNSNKKVSLTDLAEAQLALREAATKGDTKTYLELQQDIAIMGTELGQMIQSLSMIQKLSPDGQLMMLQKIVNRQQKLGNNNWDGVEFDERLIQKVLDAYDDSSHTTFNQEKLNQAIDNLKQNLADQMKVTVSEKINEWRYLSMLGNPKTHIRNIVANTAMTITKRTKDTINAGMQDLLLKKPGTKTTTLKKPSKAVKDLSKIAYEETFEVNKGNKYNEKSEIESKRKIFKNSIIEGFRKVNAKALDLEDQAFKKIEFERAFSKYLTAQKIKTITDINTHPDIVQQAKAFALEESKIATFQQENEFANWINKLDRKGPIAKVVRGAVIPFTRTPLNIAKTGLEYAPGTGLIKTLFDVKKAPEKMKGNVAINGISKQITGTSLALLGYALAKSGLLNSGDDDDKEGKFKKDQGMSMGFSIKLGNKSYDLSWLSPSSMPLFVGASMYEQLEKADGINGNVVMEGIANTLDPLSEMSCISSFTQVLQSFQKGSSKMLSQMGQKTAQNYLSQFVPTVSSQFARLFDDKKRITNADKTSGFTFGQETLNQLMYKIPGLRNSLPEQTDYFGKTKKEEENIIARGIEAFLSPANAKKDIASKEAKELLKIYDKTGEDKIIPSSLNKKMKYAGEDVNMTNKEWNSYKKDFGTTLKDIIQELMENDDYKKSSNMEKAAILNDVMRYSKDKAKDNFLDSKGIDWIYTSDKTDEKRKGYYSVAEYYIIKNKAEKIFDGNEDTVRKRIEDANDLNISVVDYYNLKKELNTIKADKNDEGKSISGSKKEKVVNYINSSNKLTDEQKNEILSSMYKKW